MSARPPSCLAFSLALVMGALAFAGCGDSGAKEREGSAKEGARVPWPLFGRVPERTHYLPAHERALDPPLREAWSISTHALIEFPPAIAGGVAGTPDRPLCPGRRH